MKTLATFLDVIAGIMAVLAILFVFVSIGAAETTIDVMTVAVSALLFAALPYFLASAVHRIAQRANAA